MSLTETLIVLTIVIIVMAGIAILFTSAREKNNQSKTMQCLLFIRSNIEQLFNNGDFSGLNNEVLLTADVVPPDLQRNGSIQSFWGPITIEESNGGQQYTITLENLNTSACQAIATLSTTSWAEVQAGGQTLYDRTVNTPINNVDLINACSSATNTVVFTAP